MGFFDWLYKEKETIEEVCVEREDDFSNFKLVTDYIYEKSGITDLDKRALTSSRAQQYAITQDVYTTHEFLNKMKNENDFFQEIMNIATVNETFFLREVKELEWLINYIKESNERLKILSMPSSSGEEIYSILLMLNRAGVDISRVDMRGYDINSQAVEQAKSGIYDEHSLHKIDEETRRNCFDKTQDNCYQISSRLRDSVSFRQNNIFDLDSSSEEYDVILSRNMFIYFDDEKRKLATDIIANLLKPDAIFIKGHADHIYKHPQLENIAYGIYKKIDSIKV